MKRSTLTATALGGLLAFGSAAHAGTLVDLFQDPPGGQSVSVGPGGTDFNQVGPFPTILDGYRDLSIQHASGGLGASAVVVPGGDPFGSGGGLLAINNDLGVRSTTVVTWDGANPAGAGGAGVNPAGWNGGLGFDLTQGGANQFIADVLGADIGFNYSIKVWDIDGDAAQLDAAVQFPVIAAPVTANYFYRWFNNPNGQFCNDTPGACSGLDPLNELDYTITRTAVNDDFLDFTQIGAFQLTLTNVGGLASADFGLGKIVTVPMPGPLALLGLGLIGIAATRRKMASRAG